MQRIEVTDLSGRICVAAAAITVAVAATTIVWIVVGLGTLAASLVAG